jgi:hypothetical protein
MHQSAAIGAKVLYAIDEGGNRMSFQAMGMALVVLVKLVTADGEVCGETRDGLNLTAESCRVKVVSDSIVAELAVVSSGDCDVTTSFSIDVFWNEENQPGLYRTGDEKLVVDGLASGDGVIWRVELEEPPDGEYSIWFIVDAENHVDEMDETDNACGVVDTDVDRQPGEVADGVGPEGERKCGEVALGMGGGCFVDHCFGEGCAVGVEAESKHIGVADSNVVESDEQPDCGCGTQTGVGVRSASVLLFVCLLVAMRKIFPGGMPRH